MEKINFEYEAKRRNYSGGVDWYFLQAMGVTVVKYQPWQIGLFYQDLIGKFVWYPRAGTLMYQHKDANENVTTYKIGNSGDFIAGGDEKYWDKSSTERVYEEIIKKVKEQHDTY